MSLSSARLIINVAAPQKDGLLSSVFSQQPANSSLYFRGDINALEVYPVKPIEGSNTHAWQPAVIGTTQLKLGIGDADQRPTSGTFALAYNASSTGLTALAYNISAANLQTAINANAQVIATGDTVAVTLLAVGVYQVAWQAVGTRLLFGSDPALLLPDSNVFVSRQQTGDGTHKDIQIIELVQRPFVYVSTWTAASTVTAVVNTIRAGDGSTKALHQITITPIPYEGTFTIQTTDGASNAIAYNATADDLAAALGGLWTAVKSGDANWTIQHSAVGASALVAGNIDVTGLKVFYGLLGTLTFNTPALFTRFLSAGNTFSSTLEAKFDDGTNRETILSKSVTLSKEILSAGGLAPTAWPGGFTSTSDVNVLIAAALANAFTFGSSTVSAAGNTTLTKAASSTKHQSYVMTASAGAGTYTAKLILDTATCVAGDITFVQMVFAASVNPTVEIRNATSGGTVLYTMTGDGSAFSASVELVYNGSSWVAVMEV